MAAAASGLSSANGDTVVNRNSVPLSYVCGRFLSLKKPVVIPSFTAAISSIWGLKERVSIVEEEDGVFVFLFKDKEEKQRVLDGGSWFYGGSMLVLADYDGLSSFGDVALHHLEIWVAVKGLRTGMRDELTLSRFGRELGEVVEVDPAAVRRRDVVQRIRIRHDVRRRIFPRRWFEFSSEFPVLLETRYEKCHGICSDCGLFGHGGGICDKGLVAAAIPGGPVTVAASDGGGTASEVALDSSGRAKTGFTEPIFSAGKEGLTGEPSQLRPTVEPDLIVGPYLLATGPEKTDGLTSDACGPFGFRKNPKKRARYEVNPPLADALGLTKEDLEEPIASLKRKSGRSFGSKNKVPRPSKKPGPQAPRVAIYGDVAVKVSPNKGKGIA